MIAANSDYGPFAPVVGYAGTIMVAAGALFTIWGGKMEKWRPPDEDLPGTARSVVLLLCGVGMVLQWFFASPDAIGWFLAVVVALAIACMACFLRYTGLLSTYIFKKRVVTGPNATREDRILGGRELLADAREKQKAHRIDVQTLLEGAAYNPDLLWSRESRRWVKQKVLTSFIMTLVFGTSALTGASFATQVMLTKEAAANVIDNSNAPALGE
jgi:hypothetical protein